MVNRCLKFLSSNSSIIMSGFTFDGGYTDLVSSGDGDYITQDTLWDFKVSKNNMSTKWSLQLLMYYILGIHSVHNEFKSIKKLGIFNPFQNKSYVVNISDISNETLYKVSKEVLGYKMTYTSLNFINDDYTNIYSTWKDISGSDKSILKQFVTSIFQKTDFSPNNYNDGIYDISIDDYWTYLRDINEEKKYQSLKPFFKWTKSIKFLKKNAFIMFISVSPKGKYSILRGASLRKASYSIEYYFENLDLYAKTILDIFSKYWDSLYSISKQIQNIQPDKNMIRKTEYSKYISLCNLLSQPYMDFESWYKENKQNIIFSGKVHGCIVDLDYSNHIYINPYDGTITPYSAISMYDKNIYMNTISLISDKRPEMLLSFKELVCKDSLLLSDNNINHQLIVSNDEVSTEFIKVYDYDMYSISNKLKDLQSIYDYGLVSIWYDNICNKPKFIENNSNN